MAGSAPYVIALDTETTGLNWYDGDYPFLATISDYDRDFLYRLDADREDLRRDILNADEIIFHNASFDIHMLVSSGVVTMEEILSKTIHDTDLLARCVLGADNGPFGLKHLATELIDAEAASSEDAVKEAMVSMGLIKKVSQKKSPPGSYHKVWESYKDILEKYALKDTRYTYDLYYVLRDKANKDALTVYELERRAMPAIVKMEHRGVCVDCHKVTELSSRWNSEATAQLESLEAMNGYEEINFDSNEQVADFLARQGVSLTQLTDTGQIRVDKWALEKYKDDHPAVATLLEYRTNTKFLSTYIDPLTDREEVHPNFWQIGARTGRMSCSNPNMQNIPVRSGPEVREIFVPREGHVFAVADYSSIELRLLDYYMADENFHRIIEDGDPFLWLGEQVYGTNDQSKWKVKRSPLKNGFYAFTYGAGGPKLATTIGGGMTPNEGRALAQRIKSALGPSYKALNNRIRKQIQDVGYLVTLGRRVQYVNPDKSYVGLNALIQGSAADIMKWGLANADEALAAIGGRPVLVVHDEIVAEVPSEKADEGLAALRAAMASATDKVNLKVKGVICVNNYGEAK
ncbi:MAG: DNA polymerase [Rhodococcus sp.]|nr:DNA polymerase [Rhodococcus sp. (in: high G+C Gram-positive bacteria)]